MIKIRKSVIFAGVALAALAAANQGELLIRRTFTEGATDTYVIQTVTKQVLQLPNGMGEQEMGSTVDATYALKTAKVDSEKKSATVELTYKIEKVSSEGALGAATDGASPETGKSMTVNGSLDELGRLKVDPPKGSSAALASLFTSASSLGGNMISVELPKQAVKVGDTWDIVVPKGPFTGSKDQKLTAKLVGEQVVGGKPAYVISTDGTLQIDADLSKMAEEAPPPMKGQKMYMKGKAELKTEGVVEKSTGKTLRMTTVMKLKQTMEIPDMGLSVESAGTVNTVSTLKGD